MTTGAVASGGPAVSDGTAASGDAAAAGDPAAAGLIRPVAELLCDIVGEDAEWLEVVGPDTRVDGDLLVESHELAAWSLALRGRYGDGVDLVAYVAGLDIDRIIGLTVADVAAYVAARRGGSVPPGDGG